MSGATSKFHHQFVLNKAEPSTRMYRDEAAGVTARLDFFSFGFRVALLRDDVPLLPTYTICPHGCEIDRFGRDKLSTDGLPLVSPTVSETQSESGISEHFSFTNDTVSSQSSDTQTSPLSDINLTLDLENFRLHIENKNGILYEDREYLAYNFSHEFGRGSYHYLSRTADEKIFGLGDKAGGVNKNGNRYEFGANDAMGFDARATDPLYKQLPFYICENENGAYGIYYDTYSNGEISLGREHNNYYTHYKYVRFNEENLVYYVIFGGVSDIVKRFSTLCGDILFPPKWTLKYCGSTMAYTDAPDADKQLRGFIDLCEKYELSAGGFYLSSGYTQIGDKRYVFHWNTDKIPSPEGLAAYFKEHGVHFIANVKPAFLCDHPLYDEIAKKGWFLHYADGAPAIFPFWDDYGSYLDFTNPEAYNFWRDCVKRELVDKGYDSVWNDNNEYDVRDENVLAYGFDGGKTPVRACDIRPLFSFLMTMASFEAQTDGVGDTASTGGSDDSFSGTTAPAPKRICAVSRCGIGGLQRIATTWTGDNRTSFADFRHNHYMAMTMSLSGFYNFGQDIGGFAGETPSRELFLRWIQYGIFTPRFVLHSWNPDGSSTMPWLYPDLIPVVQQFFALRENLLPYLHNELYRSVKTHEPIIYPVFLKVPDYDTEADCFFFGDSILACPVFDEGSETVTVDLPCIPADTMNVHLYDKTENGDGLRWYRGEVPPSSGGFTDSEHRGDNTPPFSGRQTLPCKPTDTPVFFVREGSVLPWQEADGSLMFYVYACESGSFSYEYFMDDADDSPLTDTNPHIIHFDVECKEQDIIVKFTGQEADNAVSVTVIDTLSRPVLM